MLPEELLLSLSPPPGFGLSSHPLTLAPHLHRRRLHRSTFVRLLFPAFYQSVRKLVSGGGRPGLMGSSWTGFWRLNGRLGVFLKGGTW